MPCYIYIHASSDSSRLWQYSGFCCFWWPLQLWGELKSYFVENSSFGICLMFASLLHGSYDLGEEDHRSTSVHLLATSQGTWLISVDVERNYVAAVVFVRFPHCKVTLSSPLFYYLLSGKKCTACTSLRSMFLHKLFRIILHQRSIYYLAVLHVPKHLFITVWT